MLQGQWEKPILSTLSNPFLSIVAQVTRAHTFSAVQFAAQSYHSAVVSITQVTRFRLLLQYLVWYVKWRPTRSPAILICASHSAQPSGLQLAPVAASSSPRRPAAHPQGGPVLRRSNPRHAAARKSSAECEGDGAR